MAKAASRYHVEPFKPEHLAGLDGARGWSIAITPEYLAVIGQHPAYTGFYDGQPVGAAGVVIPWRGVGEAWAITLPGVAQCPRAFHASVQRGIQQIIADYRLHRVQASVMADFTMGRKWAVSLGFHPECIQRLAGPNRETMIQFAMFPEGD